MFSLFVPSLNLGAGFIHCTEHRISEGIKFRFRQARQVDSELPSVRLNKPTQPYGITRLKVTEPTEELYLFFRDVWVFACHLDFLRELLPPLVVTLVYDNTSKVKVKLELSTYRHGTVAACTSALALTSSPRVVTRAIQGHRYAPSSTSSVSRQPGEDLYPSRLQISSLDKQLEGSSDPSGSVLAHSQERVRDLIVQAALISG